MNYTQSGNLNDTSYNLTAAMQPIGPIFTVQKIRSGTPLEVELAGTVSANALSGANGIKFELRANGLSPNFKIQGSLKPSHLNESIVMKSVYVNLQPGIYRIQVYAARLQQAPLQA